MGIKGLHKALSFCTRKDTIQNYHGQRLAIDTSSWLHRSVYSIAEQFVEATDRGRLDDPHCVRVSSGYVIARCRELIEVFGIKALYLVMDGKRCPLKADETQDREEKRRQNLAEARTFKRLKQRDKSEDKYKACIRIRDAFTRAVMEVVEKHFRGKNCVFIVWSPYEADAQLTKLCIDRVADAVVTEDSDILVYSAAAHIVFPVLFKLDRRTGACDMISMGWLLSMSPVEASKGASTNKTLETILQRLAVRQSKRPGFGVRLFVQGCVLSGSDYSINTLDGIGLIGAFKLVRDNAHRNDNLRFRKILEALPSKTKQKLSIDDYEERLAKSEAVFYYHYVKHTDGKVEPLLNPRLSHKENGDSHHFTDHSPFLSRWGDELSFLGSPSSSSSLDHTKIPPGSLSAIPSISISNNLNFKPMTDRTRQARDFQRVAPTLVPKMVQRNPYKKLKTNDSRRPPLAEKTNELLAEHKVCADGPPTSDVVLSNVKDDHPTEGKSNDPMKYLKKGTDPRYVKRQFPPVASTKIAPKYSRLRGLPSFFQLGHASGVRVIKQDNSTDRQADNDKFVPFEYDGDDDCDGGFDCTTSSTHPIVIENNEIPQSSEDKALKEFQCQSHLMESDSAIPPTAPSTSPHFNKKYSTTRSATKRVKSVADQQPKRKDEHIVSSSGFRVETNSVDCYEKDLTKKRQGIEESIRPPPLDGKFATEATNPKHNTNATNVPIASMLEGSPPSDLETSKEFIKKRADPRRVTLESQRSSSLCLSACELIDPPYQLPGPARMDWLDTPSKFWALDECIDSPGTESVPDGHEYSKPKPPFNALPSLDRSNSKKPSPRSSSLCAKRKVGPLDRAFQRQKQFSSRVQSQTITAAPSGRSVSGKRRNGADLTSYFERIRSKQNTLSTEPRNESIGIVHPIFDDEIIAKISMPEPSKKISSLVSQLQIDTNQTLDDFLWDGP